MQYYGTLFITVVLLIKGSILFFLPVGAAVDMAAFAVCVDCGKVAI